MTGTSSVRQPDSSSSWSCRTESDAAYTSKPTSWTSWYSTGLPQASTSFS